MSNVHNTINRDSFVVGQYIVGRKRIGKGAFGTVYKGYHKTTRQEVAVKEISVSNVRNIDKKIKTEIGLMKSLKKHPNIAKLYDVIIDPKYDNIYLIIEYCAGGDFSKFQNHQAIQEIHVQKYMKQLMMGIKHLHQNDVMHRDLKPQNILITKDGNIKLTDFGHAKKIKPDDMAKTYCGSLLYMAPEIIKNDGNEKYSTKTDLWSIGCIFYEMLTGSHPIRVEKHSELISKIDDPIVLPDRLIVSDEAKDLLFSLLKVDPDERISWENFFNHTWFQKDLLIVEESKLIAFDIESEYDGITTELPSISLYEKNTKVFVDEHLTSSGIRINDRHRINSNSLNLRNPSEYIVIGTPPKKLTESHTLISEEIERQLESNIVHDRSLSDMYNQHRHKHDIDDDDDDDEIFHSCNSDTQELTDSIDAMYKMDEELSYEREMMEEDIQKNIQNDIREAITLYNDSSDSETELLPDSKDCVENHFGLGEFSTSLISTESSFIAEQTEPYVIVDYVPKKNITHSDQRDYRKTKFNKFVKSSIGFFKNSLDYINSYNGSM